MSLTRIHLKPEVANVLGEAVALIVGPQNLEHKTEDMEWIGGALIKAGAEAILRDRGISFPMEVKITPLRPRRS